VREHAPVHSDSRPSTIRMAVVIRNLESDFSADACDVSAEVDPGFRAP
jgi:hypothetical protein